MLKSGIQLSQYDRCQTQRPKEFKACRPLQMYFHCNAGVRIFSFFSRLFVIELRMKTVNFIRNKARNRSLFSMCSNKLSYAVFFYHPSFRFWKYLLFLSPCWSHVAQERMINQTLFDTLSRSTRGWQDFLVLVILLFTLTCFKPIFQLFELYFFLGLGYTFLANFCISSSLI